MADQDSGWTVGTVLAHLEQRIADMREQITRERQSADARIEDLRAAVRNQSDDRIRILDERYATQTKALDAAFKAAEQAVAVALANAEKATQKAEAASEARFASVNEFRKALDDQTRNYLPRAEYTTAHEALESLVAASADRVGKLELRLTSRLDLGEGADQGSAARYGRQQVTLSQVIAALAVLVAIATAILYAVKK